jgi:hypothetical protein
MKEINEKDSWFALREATVLWSAISISEKKWLTRR